MPDVRPLRPGDPEWMGGYRLVGVLGSGGQGTVYKAVAGGGREVAVKVLHSHLSGDDDVTKGFLREVEAARRVAAFCTAAVLDVGMLDDRPYIVSEYVPGDTLQQVVRSAGPRSGGALDRLAISTLTALAAIHQAGIVHRDFKPGNVLMGPEGPIVIDFGIAKALDATTMASGPVGTPTYMSPEQFEGRRIGPASDVFSWAGTMVFAATGRPPFAGDTVPALMNAILSGAADLSGVPPHLLDPIRECLSKDPAARPLPADLLQQLIRRTGPALQPPGAASAGSQPGPAGRPSSGGPSTPTGHPPPIGAPSGPTSRPSRPAGGPAWGGPATGGPATPATRPPDISPSGPVGAWSGAAGPRSSDPEAVQAGPPAGHHAGQAFPVPSQAGQALPVHPQAGQAFPVHPGPGQAVDVATSPSGGRVSRRAVLSAAAAAAATAAVSAFVIFRPDGGSLRPGGGASSSPGGDASSPTTTTTDASPTTTDATSPSTRKTTASAAAEPFGTQVGEPVRLAGGSGAPAALAASGSGVACGTANGTVLAWDLDKSRVTKLGDGGGKAVSVAYGLFNGATAVASGHSDGTMRLWSTSGRNLASRRAGDPIIAVAVVGARAIAVSQKYDDMRDYRSTVRLWDIATGDQIGATSTEHQQGVRGLAFGWLGDDDVLVTGDGKQNVRVRRLSTGVVTHSFNTGQIGGIELLACGTARNKPILVSTHLDATLRVYDLATGKRRKKWTYSDQSPDDRGAVALAAGLLGDVPIAAVAHAPYGGEVIVRVWNLDDGEIIGVLGPGEGGAIRTLALAEQAGRPVIAGAGDDGLLRVWSLGPT
ncbi:WD40 repeat domain-containing serine/threonine protein kinase [Nonomuraea sp. SYSU D8015]|uniref:WD40 repeat domain-containing serine/threonine protein kinase n=1 Tax=Nonomuraea sp. SYSU D8015 TaxID=2593644 RepID=UPI0016613917|nr:serine/threonine-protein kinase [Nonomuraea sp. SYSU D8015]